MRSGRGVELSRLILVMIDGISADHFETARVWLPNLDRLAQAGTEVTGVSPEVCGTSAPGRTSIIAGVPPSGHGIYGNRILDGEAFRWANPWDVGADTLPALAVHQGRDVAAVGYGMVRPEDCTVYHGPWWTGEVLAGNSELEYTPADRRWLHAGNPFDPDGRLRESAAAAAIRAVVAPNEPGHDKLHMGMLADFQLMELAAGLACSEQPPDLILLEVAITDYFLHQYGAGHPMVEWSLRAADAQVGALLARLEDRGMRDQYNLAVVSDHGHAPVSAGFYVDRVLGGDAVWSSEGGVLMVRPDSPGHARTISARLMDHDIEPWNNDHLPAGARDRLLTFVMPEGSSMSFESGRPGTTGATGPSKYRSNHGMRPGTRADFRFCLFSGPDIPRAVLPPGNAIQVAPTLAKILGLNHPWQAPALF